MKILKLSLFVFLFATVTFAQEIIIDDEKIAANKLGVNINLNLGFDKGTGGGLRIFYDRLLTGNISIKPFYQVSLFSEKFSQLYSTYGLDINYRFDRLYIGIGTTYNIFKNDMEGNMPLEINTRSINSSYKEALCFDLSAGVNTNPAGIFSLNFEAKYSFLRPEFVTNKTTNNGQKLSYSTNDTFSSLRITLGISVNF